MAFQPFGFEEVASLPPKVKALVEALINYEISYFEGTDANDVQALGFPQAPIGRAAKEFSPSRPDHYTIHLRWPFAAGTVTNNPSYPPPFDVYGGFAVNQAQVEAIKLNPPTGFKVETLTVLVAEPK